MNRRRGIVCKVPSGVAAAINCITDAISTCISATISTTIILLLNNIIIIYNNINIIIYYNNIINPINVCARACVGRAYVPAHIHAYLIYTRIHTGVYTYGYARVID